MSRAVLISIQPKWCELIASGKKTVEVRKTRPKIDVPFKCYIYMTAGDASYPVTVDGFPMICHNNGGKSVIGEFVCDEIYSDAFFNVKTSMLLDNACLTLMEIGRYLKPKQLAHFWHISNLIIYDRPKELSEFYVEGDCGCLNCKNCAWFDRGNGHNVEDDCYLAYKGISEHKSFKPITRPPQSWCYVEDQTAQA